MKLGEQILKFRKKKGLSQEELGEKVYVTRQTISNWELGETSPSPEQLKLLSKELNVSIDELLDNDIRNVLVEKVSNTEKLAGLILKIIKIIIIIIIIGGVIAIVGAAIFTGVNEPKNNNREIEKSIYCKIYGEEHGCTIKYEELTNKPTKLGGDSYFFDILDLGKYNDADQIFNIINDYVKKNGGTCETIYERDLSDFIDIEIKDLTTTSMKIIIHDNNLNEIIYGEAFYIEKYVNGNWENIKKTGENYGFNDMAYHVDNSGILEMKQDWTHIYKELPKGIYRIVKNVFFNSDIPINGEDQFYIWREFEIE